VKLHYGTLFAGVLYLVIGLGMVAETLGWWDLTLRDLRYVGPLALVVAGLAVVAGSVARDRVS